MSELNYHGPVVVFDLDDTLIRERDFCRSGFRFLCNPDLYRVVDSEPYPDRDSLDKLSETMDAELSARRNPFTPFEEFFKPLAENFSSCWSLKDHIDAYRHHIPLRLELIGKLPEILDTLSRKGIRMALITDGRSVTQRCKIKASGLSRYIPEDLIYISEETGSDKHSKEMFARVVRHFPEASDFYYIGDNPQKDFYHPNLMGWTTIRVPYNNDNVHPEEDPPSPLHSPQIIIDDYSSLLQLIH